MQTQILGQTKLDFTGPYTRIISSNCVHNHHSSSNHTLTGGHRASLTVLQVTAVRRVGPCWGGDPCWCLAAVHALPGAEADPAAGARADVWRRVRQVLSFGRRDGEAHRRGHGFPRRRLLQLRQGDGPGALLRRRAVRLSSRHAAGTTRPDASPWDSVCVCVWSTTKPFCGQRMWGGLI